MNQIMGNSVPVWIGKKIYLVSYISVGEWQTFVKILQCDAIEALKFLVYHSLHRADSTIKKKTVNHLLKKYAASVISLTDIICNISFPKVHPGRGEEVDEKEAERDMKAVYRILSRMHGWSPQRISNMSPAQLYLYMMGGSTGTGIVKMNSLEYQSFLASRGIKN